MEIINVITVRNNLIENVTSYPIVDSRSNRDRDRQVGRAEVDFIQECRDHSAEERNIDSYVEDGYYGTNYGFEVSLIWSTSVRQ